MMLETDEVDDEYFTPVAGTSLANIFGNKSKISEGKVNDSLKYIPPKPQNIIPKQEKAKSTECIFACALFGHEWFNNVYTARGKLGFAIIKIQKTGAHNIVLYDSSKTTLSCTSISTNLEITIKNETYISYYDNLSKYWSIYGTKDEVKKVAEHLSNLDVNIKYSSYSEQGPPEPTADNGSNPTLEKSENIDKGSDTDSSVNRKTKASILNRMANMGHSVLPTRTLPVERTSDSSDTMESETHTKAVRHKSVKSIVKRNNAENIPEAQQNHESQQRIVLPKSETLGNIPLYTSHTGQLLPVTSSNFISNPSNELTLFISEQRISNSELRINMNRITDKVDSVLDKINNFSQKSNENIHTDILMKLLTEYENKMKVYEDLLNSRGDKNITENIITTNNNNEIKIQKKIMELERTTQEKSNEILSLQNEIKQLRTKYTKEMLDYKNKEDVLQEKIYKLECHVKEKDEELIKYLNNASSNTNDNNDSIGDKVKDIMNETFQTISVNFENNENYTGDNVKKIIASVIKKITMQTLSSL